MFPALKLNIPVQNAPNHVFHIIERLMAYIKTQEKIV